ncbi:hypothetical protein ADK57_34540 [Streptomyces sp. MMG1533]|nr:hypothetical protein ADK57_34540 [Streptomyces sp. MMG1533]
MKQATQHDVLVFVDQRCSKYCRTLRPRHDHTAEGLAAGGTGNLKSAGGGHRHENVEYRAHSPGLLGEMAADEPPSVLQRTLPSAYLSDLYAVRLSGAVQAPVGIQVFEQQ